MTRFKPSPHDTSQTTLTYSPHESTTEGTITPPSPTNPSNSSLAKRLHDLVEAERNIQTFNNIQDIRDHIQLHQPNIPDIGIDLCVLNIERFSKGWNVALIDKEAQLQFKEISNDLQQLDQSKQNNFIFRLTIWENSKNNTLKPTKEPGSILYLKRIHQVEQWKSRIQGAIRIDDCEGIIETSPKKKIKHHK